MAHWRHTAASVVAASAVVLTGQTGGANAAPSPVVTEASRQGFRAAAQIAADAYREQRRRVLLNYRDATRAAHRRLRLALRDATNEDERQAAWRAYADETAPLRAAGHEQMRQARADFRSAVERARAQFGVLPAVRSFATIR